MLSRSGSIFSLTLENLHPYNWLMYNSLPTSAIALWHALMHVNNRAGWTDEFTVANIVLQGITGLSRQGLHKARNLLIQKGLIEYKKGTSNQAGKYKLHSLVYQKRDTAVDTENTDCKKVDTLVYTVVDTEGYTEVDTENLECKKVDTKGGTVVVAVVAHYINKTKLY